MLRHPLIILLLFMCAAASGCSSPAQGSVDNNVAPLGGVGPEVYELARPGVVRVEAGLHTGTAFALDDETLVTAAHVVRDAYTIEVVLPDGSRHGARILGMDETVDLALLSVAGVKGLKPLDLSETLLTPGTEVWTIGHPDRRDWAISKGVVNSVADDGELVTSLEVGRGSSGGPVLVYLGKGRVEVAGVVSRVLGTGDRELSGAIAATTLQQRIEALREGGRVGWDDVEGYVATIHNRSPLVHQLVLARRVELGVNEQLESIYDTLTVPAFPANETLELRTTWRYFFTGIHTYRYQVVAVRPDGSLEEVHEGPLRTFTLDDDRDSFVHNVAIDIEFPRAGEYLVTVRTDGGISAVAPVRVLGSDGAGAPPTGTIDSIGFQRSPLYHALIVARDVVSADVASSDTPTPPSATANTLETVTMASPLSVLGSFNTIRLERFPMVIRFHTWTRWGYAFAGQHQFGLALVDATGRVVAQGGHVPGNDVAAGDGDPFAFELADDASSWQHVGWWEVSFDSAGLYFMLCYTDGSITRALPIWVEEVQ